MKRYIGLDAHQQSCTVVVLSETGKEVFHQIVDTNGQSLRNVLLAIAGEKHLCLEEGGLSEWLYELLEPLCSELIVVQPRKKQGVKNDRRDAGNLADDLRKGTLGPTVFKAPGRYMTLREAVRGYLAVQKDVVRAKARLHALYRSRGLSGMDSGIYSPRQRDAWLVQLPAGRRPLARLMASELDGLIATYAHAQEWLLSEAKRSPVVKRLATAPGIGLVRSGQIVAVMVTPWRFRTKRQLWAYSGLGIVTRSSSDWARDECGAWSRRPTIQTRGLNRNRHPVLKNVFKGAALTVTSQLRGHPLHEAYQRLLDNGTKPNLARLTIARRIAAAVLAMWKTEQEYDPKKHCSTKSP